MSRFGFSRCPFCDRLNIHGARCACDPLPLRPCDCTFTGNTQHIGPGCERAMNEVWSSAIQLSRTIARGLKR